MAGADEVKAEVQEQVGNGGFIERLAQRMGTSAHSSAVFGEPVERAGVTVIPVAKAAWGFGGGSGDKPEEHGLGGGGGMAVAPLGYIEVRDSGAEFKAIRDPRVFVNAAVTVGVVALTTRAVFGRR